MTVREIAERAGVSIGTVDRLRDEPDTFSAEVKEEQGKQAGDEEDVPYRNGLLAVVPR